MGSVITISAFGDNFIYLCRYDENNAFAVDPGDSSSVMRILSKHGLKLTMVFATHHHWDHIGGIEGLKRKTCCQVIGGDKRRIPGIDLVVDDGQVVTVGNTKIQVIATPGHTRTSVCYYIEASGDNKTGVVLTGDTLFVGGCGRLIECGAQAMLDSLRKLAALPDETLVYPGHDYTIENYEFAMTIEPGSQAVRQRLQEVKQRLDAGEQTVPSTMLQEKTTNPFLRADTPEIKAALGMHEARPVEAFAELRRRKNTF